MKVKTITNEMKRVAMERLKDQLQGACGSACPRNMCGYWNGRYNGWDCGDCRKNFRYLWTSVGSPCPCHSNANPEELFLRIDEVIEELKEL